MLSTATKWIVVALCAAGVFGAAMVAGYYIGVWLFS